MKQQYNDIIQQIIDADPSLKGHEDELRRIIQKMKDIRPSLVPDEEFIAYAKAELQKKSVQKSNTSQFSFSYFLSLFSMKPFLYTVCGLLLGVLIMPLWQYNESVDDISVVKESPNKTQKIVPDSQLKNDDATEASVNIIPATNDEVLEFDGENAVAHETRAQSGGGYGGGGMDASMSSRMVMPPNHDITQKFDFVYEGEIPAIDDVQIVLERIKDNSPELVSSNNGIEFPFISLNAFENLEIENISYQQNKEFGYTFYYNTHDKSVNVQKNWKQWPNVYADCFTDACHEKLRLTEEDLLPNNEAIELAQNFLDSLGVDMSSYGQPEVDNQWRMHQPQPLTWVPDQISVVYPLQIEGKDVYQQWQGKSGIRVDIDIRHKKAASAYPIRDENFKEVRYAGVSQRVFEEMIESGGLVGGFPQPLDEEDEKEKLYLSDPQLVLIETSHYDDRTQESKQLFIPAFRFTVKDLPQDYEIRGNDDVLIPLVKGFSLHRSPIGIYKKGENENDGVPTERPMIEPALMNMQSE